MTAKGVILFCCCFNLAYTRPQLQNTLSDFWKVTRPGELLRSLDTITSSTYHLTQPKQVITVNNGNILGQLSPDNSRLKRRTSEESAESLEEKKSYDYDKAYEEFVKKYFDDSLTDALSAGDSSENVDIQQHEPETYSGEEVDSKEDHEPVSEASKKSIKTEKCKNIIRGQQNCFICKNTRDGETSESCSYNKETKPQNYEFEKKKNYRKYRAIPKNNKDEEKLSAVKAKQVSNKSNDTSTFFMNKIKDRICYYCENSKGKQVTNAEEVANKKEETNGNKENQQVTTEIIL